MDISNNQSHCFNTVKRKNNTSTRGQTAANEKLDAYLLSRPLAKGLFNDTVCPASTCVQSINFSPANARTHAVPVINTRDEAKTARKHTEKHRRRTSKLLQVSHGIHRRTQGYN